MQFGIILASLAALAIAAPTPDDGNSTDTAVSPRRDNEHIARLFRGSRCTGDNLRSYMNFGCTNRCHAVEGVSSVALSVTHEETYPTVDFFSDANCEHLSTHAGVYKNYACTEMAGEVRSFKLYYDC
ncbi:hypothetical protein F5B20DRAFT_590332 [Whalleya microplaca]|nr:hypothetical protein F5B20DRAFT_590332 [Whalleya microplaca]